MTSKRTFPQKYSIGFTVAAAAVMIDLGAGCNSAPPSPPGGGNTLLTDALSYDGKVSGQVFDAQSTRTSLDETAAAQAAPLGFDTTDTVVRFQDLAGEDLIGEDGNPISPAPLDGDGSFSGEGLPVGADFAVCVDIGADQTCDEASYLHIAADAESLSGEIDDARVDPLTTLLLAKLREILVQRGIDVRELPISPAAVVARVVEAYIHLFEESGIDHEVTLADIESLTPDQLGLLFDQIIPKLAQAGLNIVEGNLDLAQATDASERAVAAAEVFLRAGFPIADEPGALDLSGFADLEEIESATREELFGNKPPLGEFEDNVEDDFADEFDAPQPAESGDPTIIYFDTTAEPDRNFSNTEEEDVADGSGGGPHLPVIADRVLLKMAELEASGAVITVEELYDALTNLENGLGARLTHEVHNPNFAGPPLTIFQTADGKGKALDLQQIFRRIFEQGLNRQDNQDLNQANAQLQQALLEMLGDTIAPDFELLFGDITAQRITSAADLAERIRDAQAHLPFNRSGPDSFFVVADGDAFRGDGSANAVTVDASVDQDGYVETVSYNANGDGEFYLGFTPRTEQDGTVQLIIRETGRLVHGAHGPTWLSLRDDLVFAQVDGEPFFTFVSDTGSFYPGVDVPAPRTQFMPPSDRPGPGENPDRPNGGPSGPRPDGGTGSGGLPPPPGDSNGLPPPPNEGGDRPNTGPNDPNAPGPPMPPSPAEAEGESAPEQRRMFVLATELGPEGEPVRVDYDRETGVATYNSDGRNLLVFTPESEATGLFVLFNADTGREARVDDPEDFFAAPPNLPEGFEDFYNDTDDFSDVDDFDDVDDFVDDHFPDESTDDEEPETTDDENSSDVPADTSGIGPAEYVDDDGRILVAASEIVGLDVELASFTRVFGTEAVNARYDADADPYFDDVDDDGVQDDDEATVPYRPVLFNPRDWRSTDIPAYYRRADDGESVTFEDVDFAAQTPKTLDGVELTPRNYVPRLNAFRFGRPNTAINLLTAFSPPEFFDGTQELTAETSVDIFTAVALVNLVMDQVFNLEAELDIDGLGPLPRREILLDAHMFIVPLDDPFIVLIRTIADRAQPAPSAN